MANGGGKLTPPIAPPGWYSDPWSAASWRWWDGTAWTGYADAVHASVVTTSDEPVAAIRAGWTALIGMIVGLGLAAAVVVALFSAGFEAADPAVMVGSALGLWTGLLGSCLVAVHRKGSGSLKDLGLARLRWVDAAQGLGFGIAMVFAVALIAKALESLAPDLMPSGADDVLGPIADSGGFGTVAVVLVAVIGAPFFEELFFRGLVQGGVVARWGIAIGLVVQAALFALMHVSPDEGWGTVGVFVMILTVGLCLGAIRQKAQRLGPALFSHAVYNAVIVTLALLVA